MHVECRFCDHFTIFFYSQCNQKDYQIQTKNLILDTNGSDAEHSAEENLTKHWTNTASLIPKDCPCYPCHKMHFGFKISAILWYGGCLF